MKKIAIVTTMWSSINNWIKPFLNDYKDNGIDVTIICNMDSSYEKSLKSAFPFVKTKPIMFPRGINVTKSFQSIRILKRFFKKEQFDLVQYSTPNASLYASVAAKKAKIPNRIYCQWGMVYVTMNGLKKIVFKSIEKYICRSSTIVQPDSKGNLDFCRENGIYGKTKSEIIWNGSAKGIDLSVFDVAKKDIYANEIKTKYNIGQNDRVIGFVGRLGKEKGCNELFAAFKILKERYKSLKLLFVGPIEKEKTIDPDLLKYFFDCEDIIKTDRVENVEKYVSVMEVFVLPTYREGFGMGVVEASAMGVPVVATKYPGPSSAMVDGKTGYSIEIGNVNHIVEKVSLILDDKELANELGNNGVKFSRERFNRQIFRQKLIENRLKLLD